MIAGPSGGLVSEGDGGGYHQDSIGCRTATHF
jgi:hypothetical protein